jgi:hypothetical protein
LNQWIIAEELGDLIGKGHMDLSRNLSPNTGELLVNSYIVAKNK